MIHSRYLLPAIAFLALSLVPASASLIVTNGSFETAPGGGYPLSCGTGCSYDIGAIPGWTNSGTSGQFQPGTTAGVFSSLPDGPTTAFTNGPTISQVVEPTVVLGTLYTLTVDIGYRSDAAAFGGVADLLINGTQYVATGSAVKGTFATFTASYTGLAADVGDAITIELRDPNSSLQGNFDGVALTTMTTAATPEPGTASMIALGAAGVWLGGRRRSRHTA